MIHRICKTAFSWLPMAGFALVSVTAGQAQTTPAAETSAAPGPVSSASRLGQVEATYQDNLRKLHAPVLQDYLRHLELMKQQFTARARQADVKKVEAEIEKVKQIISTTGIMPYDSLQLPTPAYTDDFPPPPMEGRPAPVLVLHSASAVQAATNPTDSRSLPLGTIEWKVDSLAAGSYELLVIFSSAPLAKSETLHVTFSDYELSPVIQPDAAPGPAGSPHVFHLGHITLDRDLVNEKLILKSSETISPHLFVRSLNFVRPK